MAKYVPITNGFCLVEQEIKSKKTVVKKERANHIWIYDRSGSMTGLLPELTNQLITLSKKLPKNDTLTIGWFSGPGDFNFILKGFKITEDSDYKTLEKIIKNNSSSRNTTCFSEILQETDTVISDLSALSKTFSLHFFTDGYPVVPNYQKEISGIMAAIKKIKGRITAAMFLGYGVYYNKEILTQMADHLGAMLIHSSLIPEYSNSITKLVQLSENQEAKEEVEALVSAPLAVYTVTDQGVVSYSIDEDGKLYVNPQKGKSTLIYYLSNEKPDKKSWDKVEISDVDFGDRTNIMAKALYAGILVMTQQVKTDIALEIAGAIGDRAVVDALTNAFTIEEYGKAEGQINTAIQDITPRFSKGRDTKYLPPVDAFCVLNLLGVLMNDEEAAFFPYHEKFQYERIGVAAKTKEGFPPFVADRTSKCPYGTLTWHESRLNLSVQTRIPGTVTLNNVCDKSAADIGLQNPYPSFIFRNFTFIKDGRVHIKKFYVTTSQDTYKDLKNRGLIFDDMFSSNKTYGIDISNLPAVNRAIATGKTSATELCEKVMEEQKLKAMIKSLKWLRDEEFGEEPVKAENLNDEQTMFLQANGIQADKGGVYNPPRDLEEGKDKYLAKTFDIKIAGLSSLPPVKKVAEKIASGKNRTPVEALVENGINRYNAAAPGLKTKDLRIKWFNATINNLQKDLRDFRSDIQSCKFSVLLGKQWFQEFTSRDQTTLPVNGNTFKFELGEEEVEI